MNGTRCYRCMQCTVIHGICQECGFSAAEYPENSRRLPLGTLLHARYEIGCVLGEGGFGITYIGWDRRLCMPVAVKEYFPIERAGRNIYGASSESLEIPEGRNGAFFQEGLQKYMREATILSRFYQLPGIVSVRDYFEQNNTAYIVMEYLQGITLREYVAQNGPLRIEEIRETLLPIMDAMEQVHACGILHRDISPDNIMVTLDGKVTLIDFGSARDLGVESERTMTVILKRGFAPMEQYQQHGEQGTWTDVYAMTATIYFLLSGKEPVDALERIVRDSLVCPETEEGKISPAVWHMLQQGMAMQQTDRLQTMQALRQAFCDALSTRRGSMGGRVGHALRCYGWIAGILCAGGGCAIGAAALTPASFQRPVVQSTVAPSTLENAGAAVGVPGAADALAGENAGATAGVSGLADARGSTETPAPEDSTKATDTTDTAKKVRVPSLVGKSRQGAEKSVRKAGLTLRWRYRYSTAVRKGYIVRQSPEAGKQVDQGKELCLVVSRGAKKTAARAAGQSRNTAAPTRAAATPAPKSTSAARKKSGKGQDFQTETSKGQDFQPVN